MIPNCTTVCLRNSNQKNYKNTGYWVALPSPPRLMRRAVGGHTDTHARQRDAERHNTFAR